MTKKYSAKPMSMKTRIRTVQHHGELNGGRTILIFLKPESNALALKAQLRKAHTHYTPYSRQ
jgi:hypothetical protein